MKNISSRASSLVEYKLYAPNKLGERLDSVKLNWFLCGKRHYDEKSGLYLLTIPKGVKFYRVDDGKTYFVPKDIELLIGDGRDRYSNSPRNSVSGIAEMCSDEYTCKDSVICTCFKFLIDPHVMKEIKFPEKCQLLSFAKQHDLSIRKIFPDFPTREEIDEMLKERSCAEVCSSLYDTILSYTSQKIDS